MNLEFTIPHLFFGIWAILLILSLAYDNRDNPDIWKDK